MRTTSSRFRRDQSGIAAIEVALILPVLMLLYFGLFDLTGLITINRKLTYGTSVVADLVTQNELEVSAARIDDYFKAAEMAMSPYDMEDIRVEVHTYRMASGSGAVEHVWGRISGTGPNCQNPSTEGMETLMTDGNDVVVAVMCTNYRPFIARFLGEQILGASTFVLREQISLRPRQSSRLNCSGC
ncbi:TadE/TadG family type IV pilus assembly protein [Aestuariivirga sp.]|uniref:TadE/TadG family type IV pilus assembly protein n=1 Tax=Aestuariivirga sp. TaxID=2650926 RepID=UPI00391A331A